MAATPRPSSRKERSRQAILEATRDLLAEEGSVGALTVEAVAARSGVAKTTIYRRWRDKWELALDAVMIDMVPRFVEAVRFDDPVDATNTRDEVHTFVDVVIRALASRPFGPAMQGLVSEISTDPALAREYRERAIEPRIAQLRQIVDRGIERGDLRPDTDVRLLHEFLLGPIFYRLLLSGQPLDRNLGDRLVDGVLEGFSLAGR
jgi:AcrR family transcriptional regulator